MENLIGIINYKAGNAPSVFNAYEKLGIRARLIDTEKEVLESDKLILPGVGSAKATMDSLKELNILDSLNYAVNEKKTDFFGICIGLQVLFDYSEEDDSACLGWIKGRVKKFDESKLRVPQIGWNSARFLEQSEINKSLSEYEYFYFVNSYYAEPEDKAVIFAETDYGEKFPSVIRCGNIFATQFHAEKSSAAGLALLKNFALLKGEN